MPIPSPRPARFNLHRTRLHAGLLTLGLASLLLAGCGKYFKADPKPHSVTISWTPSTSPVVGYSIYRAASPGGPYMKLNSAPVSATQYTDTTVEAGHTYAYHVTAVGAKGVESLPSQDTSATVPSP